MAHPTTPVAAEHDWPNWSKWKCFLYKKINGIEWYVGYCIKCYAGTKEAFALKQRMFDVCGAALTRSSGNLTCPCCRAADREEVMNRHEIEQMTHWIEQTPFRRRRIITFDGFLGGSDSDVEDGGGNGGYDGEGASRAAPGCTLWRQPASSAQSSRMNAVEAVDATEMEAQFQQMMKAMEDHHKQAETAMEEQRDAAQAAMEEQHATMVEQQATMVEQHKATMLAAQLAMEEQQKVSAAEQQRATLQWLQSEQMDMHAAENTVLRQMDGVIKDIQQFQTLSLEGNAAIMLKLGELEETVADKVNARYAVAILTDKLKRAKLISGSSELDGEGNYKVKDSGESSNLKKQNGATSDIEVGGGKGGYDGKGATSEIEVGGGKGGYAGKGVEGPPGLGKGAASDIEVGGGYDGKGKKGEGDGFELMDHDQKYTMKVHGWQ